MNRITDTIGYADYSWNPVTGCWGPGGTPEKPNWCSYCYARRIAERFRGSKAWPNGFEPGYYEQRLSQPYRFKKPSKIFVCDMADLFGNWIPLEYIEAVLGVTHWATWHTFLFLTKNPARLREFNPWPENCWVGATATDNAMFQAAFDAMHGLNAPIRFLSFEPLLEPITITGDMLSAFNWVILGGLSAAYGMIRHPHPDWIAEIEAAADRAGIAIWEKENLTARRPLRQEWPDGGTRQKECVHKNGY